MLQSDVLANEERRDRLPDLLRMVGAMAPSWLVRNGHKDELTADAWDRSIQALLSTAYELVVRCEAECGITAIGGEE